MLASCDEPGALVHQKRPNLGAEALSTLFISGVKRTAGRRPPVRTGPSSPGLQVEQI